MITEKLNLLDEMITVMGYLNKLSLPEYGDLASKEFVQGTDEVIARLKVVTNLESKLTDVEKESLIISLKAVDWSEGDVEWLFRLGKDLVQLGHGTEYKLINEVK